MDCLLAIKVLVQDIVLQDEDEQALVATIDFPVNLIHYKMRTCKMSWRTDLHRLSKKRSLKQVESTKMKISLILDAYSDKGR